MKSSLTRCAGWSVFEARRRRGYGGLPATLNHRHRNGLRGALLHALCEPLELAGFDDEDPRCYHLGVVWGMYFSDAAYVAMMQETGLIH